MKRASVENGCLFDDGAITIGQGEVTTVVWGVIPKERGTGKTGRRMEQNM